MTGKELIEQVRSMGYTVRILPYSFGDYSLGSAYGESTIVIHTWKDEIDNEIITILLHELGHYIYTNISGWKSWKTMSNREKITEEIAAWEIAYEFAKGINLVDKEMEKEFAKNSIECLNTYFNDFTEQLA
jgi:hypothetical protein